MRVFVRVPSPIYLSFVRQSFIYQSMLHVISQGVTPTGTVGLGSSLRTIVLAAQDLQINFIVCYKDIFQ